MKTPTRIAVTGRRQSGTAAIEFSLILVILLAMLWPTFNVARFYWQFSVVRHATSAAASYAATMPYEQLKEGNPGHAAVAQRLVQQLLAAGISQAAVNNMLVETHCIGSTLCANGPPTRVQVEVTIDMMSAGDVPAWVDVPVRLPVTAVRPYIK